MHSPMGQQAIRCDVRSCTYNNQADCCCELRSIQVSPKPGEASGSPTESMCASYKC